MKYFLKPIKEAWPGSSCSQPRHTPSFSPGFDMYVPLGFLKGGRELVDHGLIGEMHCACGIKKLGYLAIACSLHPISSLMTRLSVHGYFLHFAANVMACQILSIASSRLMSTRNEFEMCQWSQDNSTVCTGYGLELQVLQGATHSQRNYIELWALPRAHLHEL